MADPTTMTRRGPDDDDDEQPEATEEEEHEDDDIWIADICIYGGKRNLKVDFMHGCPCVGPI